MARGLRSISLCREAGGRFNYEIWSWSRRLVGDGKLLRNGIEAWVGGPQLQSPYNGGREQVNVDPADAAPVQLPIANEGDDLAVRDEARLMHLFIGSQEFPAASTVTDEKFSIDQFMSRDFIETQESVQFAGVAARLARDRIHTDVSTRTIRPRCVLVTASRGVWAHPAHEAPFRGGLEDAGTPRGAPKPPDRAGWSPYP